MRVHAFAIVDTGIFHALLDIFGAGRTLEPVRTDTLDVAVQRKGAGAPVATRRRSAKILLFAVFAYERSDWKKK